MRILIVEDEPDSAQSMAILLGIYGYDVQVTSDGLSALSAAETRPPDVVLLDLGLPGAMDGWEVARRLRQMSFSRRPRVIAVSGYAQEAHRKRSDEAGVDFHFAKPADPDELNRMLKGLEQMA